VEQNDFHLVRFGIFAHVNIPAPLYFFLKCLFFFYIVQFLKISIVKVMLV
jgi:hypothetical protein